MCEKCRATIENRLKEVVSGEIPEEIRELIPPIPPKDTYSSVNMYEFYSFVAAAMIESFKRGQASMSQRPAEEKDAVWGQPVK